jgi:SAM-dependent methyltransferase
MDEVEPQRRMVEYCEEWLERHGDSPQGVGWTRPSQVRGRYRAMLDLVRRDEVGKVGEPVELLDFGCGAAHFYEFLVEEPLPGLRYTGLDLSDRYLGLSRAKHPDVEFIKLDVLQPSGPLPSFDYVVMNGIFTSKAELGYDEMWQYLRRLVSATFPMARKGLAFNVMTTHLDWERDDLFHVPFDQMASFVRDELSQHFAFRQDYGAYEYTTYVYRRPDGSDG